MPVDLIAKRKIGRAKAGDQFSTSRRSARILLALGHAVNVTAKPKPAPRRGTYRTTHVPAAPVAAVVESAPPPVQAPEPMVEHVDTPGEEQA